MGEKEQYKNRIELLQGTLDMLILQTLQWGPQHGYGIVQALRLQSGDVLQVETGSLYPALHRLARQGWVPKTLTPGMKVTAVIHPLKDGTHGGQFMAVTLPDGTMKGNPNAAAGANAGAN